MIESFSGLDLGSKPVTHSRLEAEEEETIRKPIEPMHVLLLDEVHEKADCIEAAVGKVEHLEEHALWILTEAQHLIFLELLELIVRHHVVDVALLEVPLDLLEGHVLAIDLLDWKVVDLLEKVSCLIQDVRKAITTSTRRLCDAQRFQ